jgi:hypothetical protein
MGATSWLDLTPDEPRPDGGIGKQIGEQLPTEPGESAKPDGPARGPRPAGRRGMRHRALDLTLLVAAVAGAALAWQSGRERGRLWQEHARLARSAGELPIADPSQVHVLALDTGKPLDFAWHVYYPPGYTQVLRASAGGGHTFTTSKPTEFIARVVVREHQSGQMLWVEKHFYRSGGLSRLGFVNDEGALAGLLRGRWDKVRVEQLGSPDPTALSPDRSAVLLRLTLSDDLQAEARRRLTPHMQKQYVPVLYELRLGPGASHP